LYTAGDWGFGDTPALIKQLRVGGTKGGCVMKKQVNGLQRHLWPDNCD